MENKDKVRKHSYIIMMGHFCVDMTQGALPALIPFLIAAHGLSYTAATTLVFAGNFISAISQPIFGYLGDKVERPWFMCLGMILSGIGISLLGIFDKYFLLCVATFIMGIGTSLFHPEASKLATFVAGNRKSVGMSIFAVGGNLGFVVGPIITSVLLLTVGIHGTVLFLVPVLIITIIISRYLKDFSHFSAEHAKSVSEKVDLGDDVEDDWKGFTIVSLLMFFKSIVATSLNTFIPLFWIGIFATSIKTGNINLSIYAAAGAVGTLSGGWISEKIGVRRIYLICGIALPPLLFLFNLNSSPAIATVLVILISFAVSGAHSVLIVKGQSFLPKRIGMASGVLLGLTVSMGGVVSPIFGKISDTYGLNAAMLTIACVSLGVMVMSLLIPNKKKSAIKTNPIELSEEGS